MHDEKPGPANAPESRPGRNPVIAWFLAFVLPAVVLLFIRQSFVQQEQKQKEEQRNQEIRAFLESTPPEEMGPATRMLMGIDDPPAKGDRPKIDGNPVKSP